MNTIGIERTRRIILHLLAGKTPKEAARLEGVTRQHVYHVRIVYLTPRVLRHFRAFSKPITSTYVCKTVSRFKTTSCSAIIFGRTRPMSSLIPH